MSEFEFNPYNTLGKIAQTFIDDGENVSVQLVKNPKTGIDELLVSGSGLYLRDARCWLPDNIEIRYGVTQDTIVFIDTNRIVI